MNANQNTPNLSLFDYTTSHTQPNCAPQQPKSKINNTSGNNNLKSQLALINHKTSETPKSSRFLKTPFSGRTKTYNQQVLLCMVKPGVGELEAIETSLICQGKPLNIDSKDNQHKQNDLGVQSHQDVVDTLNQLQNQQKQDNPQQPKLRLLEPPDLKVDGNSINMRMIAQLGSPNNIKALDDLSWVKIEPIIPQEKLKALTNYFPNITDEFNTLLKRSSSKITLNVLGNDIVGSASVFRNTSHNQDIMRIDLEIPSKRLFVFTSPQVLGSISIDVINPNETIFEINLSSKLGFGADKIKKATLRYFDSLVSKSMVVY